MRKIIKALKNLISGKCTQKGHSAVVYVYSPGKEAHNGDINPNEQVAILRRLSSFVSKEGIPVTIIFPGRPSRKIPDGAKQDGVQARYATGDQLKKVVSQVVAEARKQHSVVLATDRPELEKLVGTACVRHILASTFTKSLDSICGPLQRENKQQPQQPRRQQQPQQPQPPQPQSETPAPEATTAAPEPETEGAEPIDSQSPIAKTDSSSRPKLRRHEPSLKREETDRAILDLIDPL